MHSLLKNQSLTFLDRYLCRNARKPVFGIPTSFDINLAVQTQKMNRGLKIRTSKVEGLYCLCRENKGADQLCGFRTADLLL